MAGGGRRSEAAAVDPAAEHSRICVGIRTAKRGSVRAVSSRQNSAGTSNNFSMPLAGTPPPSSSRHDELKQIINQLHSLSM